VSYCVYWIFVTLALIVMRVDERRVSRGQATLWRTILGKGPKLSEDGAGVIVECPNDETIDDSIKKGAHTGIERDIQNLTV
jgi:hypothetical protein